MLCKAWGICTPCRDCDCFNQLLTAIVLLLGDHQSSSVNTEHPPPHALQLALELRALRVVRGMSAVGPLTSTVPSALPSLWLCLWGWKLILQSSDSFVSKL